MKTRRLFLLALLAIACSCASKDPAEIPSSHETDLGDSNDTSATSTGDTETSRLSEIPEDSELTNVGSTSAEDSETIDDTDGTGTETSLKPDTSSELSTASDSPQDTGTDSGITTPGIANRTSGVAPLAVFFDAVDTPEVRQPDDFDGHREYADLHYEWSFGDDDAGVWAVSGKSRNTAFGYVASHVYENPGIYTARLTIREMDGTETLYKVSIEVEDPEVVYADDATTCVSTGDNFAGCPAGAAQLTTDVFTDIAGFIGDMQRILLRRGDTWQTDGSVSITAAGPMTIGAFGSCETPNERGICGNAPVIEAIGGDNSLFTLDGVSDLRLMDIAFVGPTDHQGAFSGYDTIRDFLALRLRARGFGSAFWNTHWHLEDSDGVTLERCDSGQSGGMQIYLGAQRLAVQGNRAFDSSDTHILRVWQAYKSIISHNELSGASIDSDTGRHALKLHGPSPEELADTTEAGLHHPTQFVVIADNLFGGSGPWPVAMGPQDAAADEHLSDIIFERNRIYPTFGNPSCCSLPVSVAVSIWARYVTARNNILVGDGSGSSYTAFFVGARGVEPSPIGTRILNNTVFKNDPAANWSEATAIRIADDAEKTVVRNNLVQFATTFADAALIRGAGIEHTVENNLLTSDAGFTDSSPADPLLKDFTLMDSSPAVDIGIPVPVFVDFNGAPRPLNETSNLGAFER